MGRLARTTLAATFGALAVVALCSCGGEDAQLLPGETAREITANLDSVQQLAAEGDCIGAESAALQVSEQIEALNGVDPKLKEALRNGATRLNEVAAECEEEEESIEPADTVPAEPESTEEEDPDDEEEEKEEEKARKDEEKAERKEENAPPTPESTVPPETTPPSTPPGQEESPSGGVEPASPAGSSMGDDDGDD